MSDLNRTRSILIREGTSLPPALSIESEAFLPGWRVVKNLDRQGLARAVEGAGWNIFYLADEMRAIVWGRERSGTLRRAVKCILAKQEGQKFNSLEITRIVVKRFLGIPFMRVAVHSRHIQRAFALVPDEDFVLTVPAADHAEAATKQYTARRKFVETSR
jgi:hypothetical protein